MAKHFDRLCKEEMDLLVCEVQSHQVHIYGTPGKPPNANYVKTALEEVTAIVSASSLGPLKTVGQCRKRFNYIR